MNIEQQIACTLQLEKNILDVGIIDSIKILEDFLYDKKIINIFSMNRNSDELSNYIAQFLLNPFYLDYINISQTYFSNMILDLHFILNNPFLYNSKKFKIIGKNLDQISKIPKLIEKCLDNTYNCKKLKYFYNEKLFKKWKDGNNFTKISYEKYINTVTIPIRKDYILYEKIWDVFVVIVMETKKIVDKYYDLYKNMYQRAGCINICKEFYSFCVEINTTVPFNKNILKWGLEEFEKIKIKMNQNINNYDNIYKDMTLEDKIKKINNNTALKYTTEKDFIDHHNIIMNEYIEFFINKKKLPLLKKPTIVSFNDKTMAGGYWYEDSFYLNTSNYKDTNKFETKALVMHETIPGHHLQLSYALHKESYDSLLLCWFPTFVNGYAEGWGLFAENLADNINQIEYVGITASHMFRTIRIIADVGIHMFGIDPEEMIDFFSMYLPMSRNSIESEIYRYICMPGQAMCYKVGYEIIKRIYVKRLNRTNMLNNDDAIQLYKELIVDRVLPLELLAKKHNISYSF